MDETRLDNNDCVAETRLPETSSDVPIQEILAKDRVCRRVRKSLLDDPIPGAAFLPQEGDPTYSMNWLEYHRDIDFSERLNKVRDTWQKKRKSISNNELFAIATAEEVRNLISDVSPHADLRHDPVNTNDHTRDESHAAIYDYLKGTEAKQFATALASVEWAFEKIKRD